MEQAMKGSIPVTEHEGSSILARARAEGVKLGMRKGLKQGREQGREQGLEMGREQGLEMGREQGLEMGRLAAVQGVLRVLAARGLEVTAEEEERIRACRDLGTLEGWIEQSLWVDSVDELFE
jgi:flagellar biosynthesis/type III secretory pathway protein FliH